MPLVAKWHCRPPPPGHTAPPIGNQPPWPCRGPAQSPAHPVFAATASCGCIGQKLLVPGQIGMGCHVLEVVAGTKALPAPASTTTRTPSSPTSASRVCCRGSQHVGAQGIESSGSFQGERDTPACHARAFTGAHRPAALGKFDKQVLLTPESTQELALASGGVPPGEDAQAAQATNPPARARGLPRCVPGHSSHSRLPGRRRCAHGRNVAPRP